MSISDRQAHLQGVSKRSSDANKENGAPVDRRSFLKSAGGTAAQVASGASAVSQAVPQPSLSPSSAGQGMRIPVINPKD